MKEMKTKEEILNEFNPTYYDKEDLTQPEYSIDSVLLAMDEYASQFRQEWIPVEERLPEETTTNFITAKKLSGRMVFIDHKYEVWYSRGANTWYCGVHLFKDYFPDLTIVAWQPVIIPQPYNHTKS